MSSSISNSESSPIVALADLPGRETGPLWRRWLWILAFLTLAPFAALYAIVVVVDPFSTGRFTPITRIDIATHNLTLAHAGRVRDLTFNAAIFANSRGMTLDPVRLTALTGRPFVQLSGYGYGPQEVITIAHAFVRHHRGRSPAAIFVLDEFACAEEERTTWWWRGGFPYYLFENSRLAYLRNVLFPEAIKSTGYRLLILAGLRRDRARRDGFEPAATVATAATRPEAVMELKMLVQPTEGPAPDRPFVELERLRRLTAELDGETRLILFLAPVPFGRLPAPGSRAEARLLACKAGYRALAAGRPNTRVIDRWIDDEFTRDVSNFSDPLHIRAGLAPILERDIAAALASMSRR